jgi:hypothetical protein
MRMVVVLPAPFGPRSANNSPRGIDSDRSATAVRVAYIRLT